MLARKWYRAPLVLLVALSVAACQDKSSAPPVPTPDRAAVSPTEAATTEAKLAAPPTTDRPSARIPATAVVLDTSASAAPAEKLDAKAEVKAETKAPAKAGDVKAKAPDAAASGAPSDSAGGALPTAFASAKNGILPPGAADKILAVGARPLVKLVSPGAEPRSELVYDLTKGVKQSLGMSMDMAMSLKIGPQAAPPVILPRMMMGLDMTAADKDARGDWKIDALLNRVTIEAKGAQQEQMAKQMRPHMDGMKGLTMAYFVTPKGHVHDVSINTPPNFPAQAQQMLQGMNQSFESMVAPFPSDAVGVGAKWEVTTRVASGGADLLQFSTYVLKERKGSQTTLDVTVTQVAASEMINAPGMPAGAAAKLTAFHSGGGGSSRLDTKSVAPLGGKMSVKSGMDLEVSAGGAGPAQQTSVNTDLTVEFSRPKGG